MEWKDDVSHRKDVAAAITLYTYIQFEYRLAYRLSGLRIFV